ncbi:hypothetical protein DE146DRAFT_362433 [Phaeosphaeria sp. MPI-PUGE-AT-0046c]|nr:hypothetical protein DE146DRAFT_362433 [Phaeosphaeria sp. MPI-PUGE-AT-0046c]
MLCRSVVHGVVLLTQPGADAGVRRRAWTGHSSDGSKEQCRERTMAACRGCRSRTARMERNVEFMWGETGSPEVGRGSGAGGDGNDCGRGDQRSRRGRTKLAVQGGMCGEGGCHKSLAMVRTTLTLTLTLTLSLARESGGLSSECG